VTLPYLTNASPRFLTVEPNITLICGVGLVQPISSSFLPAFTVLLAYEMWEPTGEVNNFEQNGVLAMTCKFIVLYDLPGESYRDLVAKWQGVVDGGRSAKKWERELYRRQSLRDMPSWTIGVQ